MRTAAIEMLRLERIFQEKGELTPAEHSQWQKQAEILFGPSVPMGIRRSFRIPADCTGVLRSKARFYQCLVVEVSMLNLTLQGDVFSDLPTGEGLVLEQVSFAGRRVSTDIKVVVVRHRNLDGVMVAGVELQPEGNPGGFERYVQEVYLPMYLAYLESLT